MMRTSGVYVIENVVDGMVYVGSSTNIELRKSQHFSHLRSGVHHNQNLQREFNLYGSKRLEFRVVEHAHSDDLLRLEQLWLDKIGKDGLYNIYLVAGSALGRELSQETKEVLRKKSTGRKKSPEEKAKRLNTFMERYGGSPKRKRVRQIDAVTGETIRVWDGMAEAATALGMCQGTISGVCCKTPSFHKGQNKWYIRKTTGGFRWEFDE